MENEILANEKILTLNRESSSFKILNAMLNSINGPEYEGTKKTVIEDILNAQDLEEIAAINDDCFLMPMRARGKIVILTNSFESKVRERDGNKCVLTGEADSTSLTKTKRSFQVAHFIPHSLLDEKKDSDERKTAKRGIRGFILRLCPWLPPDFFENLDVCENGILLSSDAHNIFGAFDWFVTMETGIDGKTIYKAMQVEENGLLKERFTGREFELENSGFMRVSSYNQPLFIGDSHPQPGFIYVKLHEMLARIFKMRGQAGYYEQDSNTDVDH